MEDQKPTRYSLAERIKFVQVYYMCNKSFSKAMDYLTIMKDADPNIKVISDQSYRSLIKKFEEKGNLEDDKRPGRSRTARTPENIEKVKASMKADPTCSTRKRSSLVGINKSTLRRILSSDLKLKEDKTGVRITHKNLNQKT